MFPAKEELASKWMTYRRAPDIHLSRSGSGSFMFVKQVFRVYQPPAANR
jgi:hypothetical protein